MAAKLSFLIVEKSYIIRSGLMQIISNFYETGVVNELHNVENFLKKISGIKPDVLIINAKLIDTVPELILDIRKKFKDLKLIVFVGTRREADNFSVFDLKISVDEPKSLIVEKIQSLINEIKPKKDDNLSENLSEREKDVVKQIALGKTNKEIGEALFISAHTVITHRKNITRKLGIKTVSGLTVYAILNNLIKIDEAV